MSAILYYISLPFIYLVSILPFPVLYFISDGVYVLIYRIFGYRKEVVFTNLRKSFPEKSEAEIKEIAKKFYHHLCDLLFETLKILTISKSDIIKRCKFDPAAKALFDEIAEKKQSIVLVMGHQGNWEWSGHPFSLILKQQLYVIYHPLANKYFDKLVYHMRTRNGTKLMAMRDTFKEMVSHKGEVTATAFIADQTPSPTNAYWTKFLNQDTPVFFGTEKISRKLNYPVVYAKIVKTSRGHYTMFSEMLEENPKHTRDGEISELYTRKLQEDIIAQPETWLWSHRRWKHEKPAKLIQAETEDARG